MFRERKEEVRVSWWTFRNEEFNNLQCYIIIIIIIIVDNRDSVVGIEIRLGAGQSGLKFQKRRQIFLFSLSSRPTLVLTHLSLQWVGQFLPGGKAAGA